MPGLQVQVLGPVGAWQDGRELELGPTQQRAVLAVLALAAGKVVPRYELANAVWDSLPRAADGMLYKYISQLRRVLEPGRERRGPGRVLATSGPGYVLQVGPDGVDAALFTAEVAAARRAQAASDLAGAAGRLEAALGLWQGSALAGMTSLWAQAQQTRLEEARLAASEEYARITLALGDHSEMAAELAGLVGRYPLREGLAGLLMLALYRCGRQADALEVFQRIRRVLDAELGIRPGRTLQELYQQILTVDPALDWVPPVGRARRGAGSGGSVPVPRELPADVRAFTGREAELAVLDSLLAGASWSGDGQEAVVVISAVSGMAGAGKTALAIRWAHRAAGKFPDGQLYVNLRGYDPDEPVAAADALAWFLRALGVTELAIPPAEAERAARYRSLVAGKRMLVVLDNAGSDEQVRPLLPGSPSVVVLVTSRDTLSGLVARDGAHRLELDRLPAADPVMLLRTLIGERVDADPMAAQTLAGQCAQLPLALRAAAELADACPHTPLAELSAELADEQRRLELLDAVGDTRTAVTSVFSWSYRQLPLAAARMFRMLGLHPGPDFDCFAAAALTGTGTGEAGQLLGALARAHLIQPAGLRRFGMHDLLRAYAARLAIVHDQDETRQAALTRLFDYYLSTAVAAMNVLVPVEAYLRNFDLPPETIIPELPGPRIARTWLDAERATLVAVAAYSATHGWPGHAIRLTATLNRYLGGGYHAEALALCAQAEQAARESGHHAARAYNLMRIAYIYTQRACYQLLSQGTRRGPRGSRPHLRDGDL